jgi:hypothetical protein
VKKNGRRLNVRKSSALAFISNIESTWKGHESFALWLVAKVKPKTVVDLGFDRGLSTIAFAYKNRGHVYGIDWFSGGNYAAKCFALDSAYRNISNAIRFHYAKNIHLIVGPYKDVLKTWTRPIDILHIDYAHTYAAAKQQYNYWSPYLSAKAVILVHDVLAYPNETGRFFEELPFPKMIFTHGQGLGVACSDASLIEEINHRATQREEGDTQSKK